MILVLGDSLSSAFGLSDRQGWVALLQQRLTELGHPHEVINASVSGDTTINALARLEHALGEHDPAIVIVEIGGNDGLRAQPVAVVRQNLRGILQNIREHGAKIVLAGIRLPPNYGPSYVGEFERMYPDLAEEFQAALVPFFMRGVATDADLMQPDGVHPNARAQPILLDNVWPVLEPLLQATTSP